MQVRSHRAIRRQMFCKAFGLGKLDDSSAAVLMNHLDQCADCCKVVASQSGDDFLDRLRQVHGRNSTSLPPTRCPHRSVIQSLLSLPQRIPPPSPICRPNWPAIRNTRFSANWAAAAWASSTWPKTS